MVKNIFEPSVTNEVISRINKLTARSQPLWGKMSVGQMLAHCNVTYELVFDNIHKKPGGFKKFILKLLVKKIVTNETPYKQNNPTAPEFLVTLEKDFDKEKARLIAYLQKVQQLGGAYFQNKESHSFGPLSTTEWNNMFYKHIDHHLRQFGA